MSDHRAEFSRAASRRLAGAIVLNILITVAEIVGGVAGGSLALISDALHNFSDAVALAISGVAIRLARQPRTPKYTFGLKRAEILAAVFNAVVLVVVGVFLVDEAIERLRNPVLPAGSVMIVIGAVGLLANAGGTLLLRPHVGRSLNLRSSYLHLFGDSVSSLGVIAGGIAVQAWSVPWIDPAMTFLITLYVLWESYKIIKEATNIIMMGAPTTISLDEIHAALRTIPCIANVHHVHLWQLSETDIHFEAHVSVDDMLVSKTEELIHAIESKLQEGFGIRHVTIQCECDRCGHERLIIR